MGREGIVICVSESFSHKHVHQTRLAFPDLVDRDSSGAACILLCVSESTERAVSICDAVLMLKPPFRSLLVASRLQIAHTTDRDADRAARRLGYHQAPGAVLHEAWFETHN